MSDDESIDSRSSYEVVYEDDESDEELVNINNTTNNNNSTDYYSSLQQDSDSESSVDENVDTNQAMYSDDSSTSENEAIEQELSQQSNAVSQEEQVSEESEDEDKINNDECSLSIASTVESKPTTSKPTEPTLERITLAAQSRSFLFTQVRKLPFKFGETSTIYNFGYIKNEFNQDKPKFSSSSFIHPIGFDCIHLLYSPTHGRMLKLRCEIIDGPLFRISWGRDVDEYKNESYEKFLPCCDNTNTLAPLYSSTDTPEKPDVGMRCKVRFDEDQFYDGVIVNVKRKVKKWEIKIQYDDGGTEDADYPDDDEEIELLNYPPLSSRATMYSIIKNKQPLGKNADVVCCPSALEAWATVLIRLGLIDEVIFAKAMESLAEARKEGKAEVKGRLELVKLQRKQARERQKAREKARSEKNGDDEKPKLKCVVDGEVVETNPSQDEEDEEEDLDDASKKSDEDDDDDDDQYTEDELQAKYQTLLTKYNDQYEESNQLFLKLSDLRLSSQNPFLHNPFKSDKPQQLSWLYFLIKKEKLKMSSTGNKRKILTPTDLLEKMDTFFGYIAPDLDRLIEGLPGSEYCPNYVFHGERAGGMHQSWMNEMQLKQDKERDTKSKKETKEKEKFLEEKEMKRKEREEERLSRKKQKVEEMNQKKKQREEERLSRLNMQVEDRLFKEACFQREKVVLLAVKALSREFMRRRKAAEVFSSSLAEEEPSSSKSNTITVIDDTYLPPTSKKLDEDVIKLWDFMTSFSAIFGTNVVSLQVLQDAIDSLRNGDKKGINVLISIAIMLCQPLSAGLVKLLGSVVTTTPVKTDDSKTNENASQTDSLTTLPVNTYTWKEVARLSLLADALNELSFSKQDSAHILRGHRSGGHPLSKESRKLRQGEDFINVLLRQSLKADVINEEEKALNNPLKVSIPIPSTPCVNSDHWLFYLFNIQHLASSNSNTVSLKNNLRKALSMLRSSSKDENFLIEKEVVLADLQKGLGYLESSNDTKAKQVILRLLDKVTGEVYSKPGAGQVYHKPDEEMRIPKKEVALPKEFQPKYKSRLLMGYVQNNFRTSQELVRQLNVSREEYTTRALKEKKKRDRKEKKKLKESGAGDDVPKDDDEEEESDDDDDEEEEEDAEQEEIKEEVTSYKIGKVTPYDDFCADDPSAHELIRRCLAVTRTLCISAIGEAFIYPVDPQSNSRYYEAVLRPMCLQDIGKMLQDAGKRIKEDEIEEAEKIVADFSRNVRLIAQNCSAYSNVGAAIISSADQLMRLFERLLLDWVLAPPMHLTPLELLNDDNCIGHHVSDVESVILLCDGCEGKYNMTRLDPPLVSIPQGDWYCSRCLDGRCWGDLDPRVGKEIKTVLAGKEVVGIIKSCMFCQEESEGSKPTLVYTIQYPDFKNIQERWTLEEVDAALENIPPVRCIEALAESSGYGIRPDSILPLDFIPPQLNPHISDSSAQTFLSSSTFRDSIQVVSTLALNPPEEMTASEWLKLLTLLSMKCATSEELQEIISKKENEAAEKLAKEVEGISKVKSLVECVRLVTDTDDDVSSDEEKEESEAIPDEVKSKDDKSTSSKRTDLFADSDSDEKMSVSEEEEWKDAPQDAEDDAIESKEPEKKKRKMKTRIKKEDADKILQAPSQEQSSTENGEIDPMKQEEINIEKQERDLALNTKAERSKSREDSYLAYGIKRQIQASISSFEEDNFTPVIESTLASKDEGLSLDSCKHEGKCEFCGLTDVALGLPLVRVPSKEEWEEILPHLMSRRVVRLIAECQTTKLKSVSVRINGELQSWKDTNNSLFGVPKPIVEFAPRNINGFQHELSYRHASNFPFVTGSLSAHECCALSIHTARTEKKIWSYRDQASATAERDYGRLCGRTLPIGKDKYGRIYWSFHGEPTSLFVCLPSIGFQRQWHQYSEPEEIASVIVCLGKQEVAIEIKRLFPKAQKLIRKRRWMDILQKRAFKVDLSYKDMDDEQVPQESCEKQVDKTVEDTAVNDAEEDIPFEEGEEVLVESNSGKLLWDATIVAVSKNKDKVNGYRVHYTDWNSRFDEWVAPIRVVEPNDNNIQVQEDMLTEFIDAREGFPEPLANFQSRNFIKAKNRARGNTTDLPPFTEIVTFPNPEYSSTEVTSLATLKALLLMIESALPEGSIPPNSLTKSWRDKVQNATGAATLMGCLVLLEDSLNEKWIEPQAYHLLTCMPRHWRAIQDASLSAVALRIWILDGGIKFGKSEKVKSKKKK